MKRPKLNKKISIKNFKNYYWLKNELIIFCRENGMSTFGSKIEISDRIGQYLKTGKKVKIIRNITTKSKFDWKKESLSDKTVITDNYQNTENVRNFFIQSIGNQFKFNVEFMKWMKENTSRTLEEAVKRWNEISIEAKGKNYKTKIAPQFEYNKYIREFLNDNPGLSLKEAIKCWKIIKEIPGKRVYSRKDIKKLFFIIILILFTARSYGQKCNCSENLQFIQNYIEQNYAGYKDKVDNNNTKEYKKIKDVLIVKSKTTTVESSCVQLLNEYISFFKDGHIQIFGRNGPIINTFLNPNYDKLFQDYKHLSLEFKELSQFTVYLRLGTFSERVSHKIDSIIEINKIKIENAKNIIIDIRGNVGGATFTYAKLIPYLYTDTIHFIGFDVYATKQNIEAYKKQLKNPYIPKNQLQYIRSNIELMKKSEGDFVSLSDDYFQVIPNFKKNPKKIAVLIDNLCGSTAEHFLFTAMQSEKVTILGEPTIGMYDYGDMKSIPLPSIPYQLWYATTRSRRLNVGQGIDNIGIQPNIYLNRNKNWIKEARAYLEE